MKMNQKSIKEWFKDWANEYDELLPKNPEYMELLDEVIKYSCVKDHYRVLDIGAGTGLLTLKFLNDSNVRVIAFDISEDMLSVFRKKLEKLRILGHDFRKRVDFKIGSAVNLPFGNEAFHIVVSSLALHHIVDSDKSIALREINRVLKQEGKLFIIERFMDTTGELDDIGRFNRIMEGFRQSLSLFVKTCGYKVIDRLFDDWKRVFLRDGEYIISMDMWAKIAIEEAGFKNVEKHIANNFGGFEFIVCEK